MTDKRKRILLTLTLNLIFLIGLALIWNYFLLPKIEFVDTEEILTLEKGGLYPAEAFIKKTNGTVTPNADPLPAGEVGEFQMRYSVKRWLFTREYDLHYRVVDTTPPQITVLSEKVVLDPGAAYEEQDMLGNVFADEGELVFDTDLDSAFPGTYVVHVTATDASGNRSEAQYEIFVGDHEAPIVFRSGDGTVIEVGDELDLRRIISYGDNADSSPQLEMTGTVDASEPGKYPIHAVLTDASGNKTEWTFNVQVVEEIPNEEPQYTYYYYSDFLQDHAGEGTRYGIDVSRWQGNIDFNAVKNAGCEFVMIRIGYSEEGVFYPDKYFEQNLAGAKRVGLPVGIYLFSYDNNEEDVRSSAEMMFEELGGEALELPVVFDWENFSRFQDYRLSFQGLNHLYDVFEEEVTSRGYDCMLYGSKYYLQAVWKHTDSRPIWLAHFTRQTSYEGPYRMWQVSGSGKIDGIDGFVDMDILYDD